MNAHKLEMIFFFMLLAIALVISWLIFAPYVSAIVLAGTLAFLFLPAYKNILRLVHHPSPAALITVIAVILIVFLPLGFFATKIFSEATALYASIAPNSGADLSGTVNNLIQSNFGNLHLPQITVDFGTLMRQILNWFLQNLGPLFSNITQILLGTFLSLLGLFYLLKEGENLKKWIFNLISLEPKYEDLIMREMGAIVSSVVKGTIVIALIQGIVAGVGFAIFNLPSSAFWGSLVVVASLVPLVGAWIVLTPAIIYLFLAGQIASGIGLAIWSIVIVTFVYNILAPQLMGRGNKVHPYIILLSVLGGIALFGPMGLLMGPFVIAFLLSLLKIYPDLILKRN
jgi:predicted PurR-regulated permease PerM